MPVRAVLDMAIGARSNITCATITPTMAPAGPKGLAPWIEYPCRDLGRDGVL